MNRYSDRADIMAIGDSMYQGVHSLSLPPWMMDWTTPAQVARALGRTMVTPDLTHPLLWDLNDLARKGDLLRILLVVRDVCLANLPRWDPDQPWSGHEAFDNVAILGADTNDLLDTTYDDVIDRVRSHHVALRDPALPISDFVSMAVEFFFAAAAAYALNPRHRAEQGGKSQVQQAIEREPVFLLINIGANDGLFDACFEGEINEATHAKARALPAKVRRLAEALRALSPRTERVVFNGLIRPSFVPNLVPDALEENAFPNEGYFTAYGSRLLDTQRPISRNAMREYDRTIAEVNAENREIMREALGDRARFADLYAAAVPFDGKHFRNRGLDIPGRGTRIDNRPITPRLFRPYIGGFTSLDNMHPSVVGYAVLADAVLQALGQVEPATDKRAAFDADRLLSDFPGFNVLRIQIEVPFVKALFDLFSGRGAAMG
jgi:lysophospholipase L1-like esterase